MQRYNLQLLFFPINNYIISRNIQQDSLKSQAFVIKEFLENKIKDH